MTKTGVIYKISIKNFVTYTDVEIYPGPNLNIVIGPNGTGKSTIVAAIILGLGGTPKTIGRGTTVSEYVKHDCSEARIDIELYGVGANSMYTITRIFNLNNQNTWFLNNKTVNEQAVKNAVLQLNIQVNNLCQFLPQDRVQDFAKMDKKELLVNTQKVVGRQDLVDKQKELIIIKKDQKILEKDMQQLNTKLDQAKSDISRLEVKVQNLNEKKKLKGEIDSIKCKIYWENYNKLLITKKSVEEDKIQASNIVNAHKKKIQPVENKISEHKKLISVLQNKLLQCRSNLTNLDAKIKNLIEKLEEVEDKHKEITIEMRSKLQALEEFQNEIDALRSKIDKLINDENSLIVQLGEEKEIDDKADKLKQASNMYQRKSEEVNTEKLTASNVLRKTTDQTRQLEEKLREMENIKEMRLQILGRRDKDAYNAVLWLRENRDIFRGNVYEPVMLELNVINPAHSKYLENIVPFRDRVAFTCEYREDMNLLLQKVREEKQLKINVLHSGSEHPSLSTYRPAIPIEQLRKYGFFAYINSLITGPEPIIKYLCRMYGLHNIPIGDNTTYSRSAQVPEHIRLFFSDAHRFAVSVSRYTGEKSTRISDVESDGTFSVCVDYDKMHKLKQELEEAFEHQDLIKVKINEFEAKKQAMENKRLELLKQRQYLLQQKEQIKVIKDRKIAANRTLDEYLREHRTPDEIKEKANNKIKSIIKNSIKIHKSILIATTEFDEQIQQEKLLTLELSTIHEQITHMENEIIDFRTEYEEAKVTYNKIECVYNRAVQDVEEAMRAAKKLTRGLSPSDSGFEKIRKQLDKLPSDLEELKDMINELQAKIECILIADDGELRQYEDGTRMIATCQEELSFKSEKLNEYNTKIETMYQAWIDPLQELVSKINRNFGDYFESMQCAGEVVISKESGEEEYADYGLCIRVTYRTAEPLQELNRYVQSGGERAVATAVYMLAMQDLTAAPFRCVDEINQGMDPQNERRIFEILVKATNQTDCCQYFLITPKLIAALQFGTAMKVHIVHNGPFCEVGKQFNSSHSLRNSR